MKKFFIKIKYNFLDFWKNQFLLAVSLLSIILAGLHGWQYYASNYNINCLIRLILFSIIAPSSMLFGKKAPYLILIIFSIFAVWINQFNNYTSFFCLLLSCRMYRRSEKYLIGIYAINLIFAYTIMNYEVSHLAIHFCFCVFIYIIYFYINSPKMRLELKRDEEKILEEIYSGVEIKALKSFSKNIVYQKLKEARERNGIATNEELIERFKKQKDNSGKN